jgi:hypothetical protein
MRADSAHLLITYLLRQPVQQVMNGSLILTIQDVLVDQMAALTAYRAMHERAHVVRTQVL